jgi:hypothetical protein
MPRKEEHVRSPRAVALVSIIALYAARIACAAGTGDEPVTVISVRIFTDDIRYDWREGSPMPDRAQGGFTEPSTVASFLGVRPGEEMASGELERRRALAEERLAECGYFFASQVLVVPASSRADGRLLVVKVREGFLWRFGGGPYFASIGRENVFGARKSWSAAAGYNLDGISWRDDAVFNGPLSYEIGFFYTNALGSGILDFHRFALPLSAGLRLSPDFTVSLGAPLTFRLYMEDASPLLEFFPQTADCLEWAPEISFTYETVAYPLGVRVSLGARGKTGISLDSTGASSWRIEGGSFFGLSVWPGIYLRASGGTAMPISMDLPVFTLFNLADTPSRAIRAGYGTLELLASRYAMAGAELRFPLPRIPLGSIFSLSFAPFLYAEAALAETVGDGVFRDLEGFGLGARIGFENPVFAYFSISYGWNPQGNGRFCFFAVSGGE